MRWPHRKHKVFTFLDRLQEKDLREVSLPIRYLLSVLRYTHSSVSLFLKDQCIIRASGLAFNTLLALVPLTALLFSLFTAFGAFENMGNTLQDFLLETLVPTRQDELLGYINQFVANTQALGVIGFLVFLFTSVLLLNNINNNFNAVWGVSSKRNFISKLTTYTSILILGSLLISASFSITAAFQSVFSISIDAESNIIIRSFLQVAPKLFITLAFLLMIMLIPEGRVEFRCALTGAIIGAVLWGVVKSLFQASAYFLIRLSLIYGSLALIPVFLIWLHLAWSIVLFSLEATFVFQNSRKPWTGTTLETISPMQHMRLGLKIFLKIAEFFHQGKQPITISAMANEFAIAHGDIVYYTNLFSQNSLIISLGERNWGFVPGRSLNTIGIDEVMCILYTHSAQIPHFTENTDTPQQTACPPVTSGNEMDSADFVINTFLKAVNSMQKTGTVEDLLTRNFKNHI